MSSCSCVDQHDAVSEEANNDSAEAAARRTALAYAAAATLWVTLGDWALLGLNPDCGG